MKEAAILDRACDVSKFASEDPNRHIINSVHFTKQGVEATDGMVLIQVPYPATSPEQWAPDALPANGLHPDGATISASTLAETAKTLPKKLKCYGDMRGAFAVSRAPEPEDKKTDRGPVIITRIDNDFQPAVTQAREMPEGYPTFDHVMPKEEPSLSITLSADLLKKIADYAIANGENVKGHHPVRLDFTDPLSPVRFTVPLAVDRERKATGIVMAMRMV